MDAPHINALNELGFTPLEAAVYGELLRRSPATGYAVAKRIGKAAANVYQALNSLAAKGAVLVEDQEGRVYRATAPAELLAGLTETFLHSRTAAAAALEDLRRSEPDDRIYTLSALPQVFERARRMIEAAREILLFDAFPGVVSVIWPGLAEAAARGVTVAGIIYADPPGPAPGAHIVRKRVGEAEKFFLDRWPGQQLTLIRDAREHLTALVSRSGSAVEKAMWSDSAYLSCLHHNGLSADIRATATEDRVLPFPQISLLRAYPPGLRQLIGVSSEDIAT